MNRVLGSACMSMAAVLMAAGSVAPASATPVPSAASWAKNWHGAHWTTKRYVAVSRTPVRIGLNVVVPVLAGADAKDRKLVTTWVSKQINQQKSMVAAWRLSNISNGGCQPPDATYQGYISGQVSGGIYARRYASAAMIFTSDSGCGGVDEVETSTGVWDVAAHRQLSIGALAVHPFNSSHLNLQFSLSLQVNTAVGDCVVDPGTFLADAHMVRRFDIVRSGLRFHINKYEGGTVGACGGVTVVIPWEKIVLTKQGAAIAKFYGHHGSRDYSIADF